MMLTLPVTFQALDASVDVRYLELNDTAKAKIGLLRSMGLEFSVNETEEPDQSLFLAAHGTFGNFVEDDGFPAFDSPDAEFVDAIETALEQFTVTDFLNWRRARQQEAQGVRDEPENSEEEYEVVDAGLAWLDAATPAVRLGPLFGVLNAIREGENTVTKIARATSYAVRVIALQIAAGLTQFLIAEVVQDSGGDGGDTPDIGLGLEE